MTTQTQRTKRVAILVENEFEDIAFKVPNTALKQAGAIITVLGARMNDDYKGHHGTVTVTPDATTTEVHAEDFDAFVILGGSIRVNPNVIRLVREAIALKKWVVAIGIGPQVLIEADQLSGKQITGFRAIRKDIEICRRDLHRYADSGRYALNHCPQARRFADCDDHIVQAIGDLNP